MSDIVGSNLRSHCESVADRQVLMELTGQSRSANRLGSHTTPVLCDALHFTYKKRSKDLDFNSNMDN